MTDQVSRHPTEGREDELLADPPETGVGGMFEGYRRGARARWMLWGASLLGVGLVTAGILWARRASEVRPNYALVDTAEVREDDRVLHWATEGEARLGLTREPPGVHTLILPDRIVRLADDQDHAQVLVRIENGETRAIKTLTGRVHTEPRSTQDP